MTIRHDGRLGGRLHVVVSDAESGESVKLRCLEHRCGAEFPDRDTFLAADCPLGDACGKPKPRSKAPRKKKTTTAKKNGGN
jgi:hypothetical protein